MNAQQISGVAAAAGFSGAGLAIAVAVALAESGGRPDARCQNCIAGATEDSRGLWQINVRAHPQYATVNLYDPSTNAAAAYAVSGGGSNWRPWTTYKTGAYLRYMPGKIPAAPAPAPPPQLPAPGGGIPDEGDGGGGAIVPDEAAAISEISPLLLIAIAALALILTD